MSASEMLAQERRGRLAAERLLALKQSELQEANRKLSHHAISLTEEIVETRGEVQEVREENTQVRANLERVTEEVSIAKRRLWDSIETIHDGFAVFGADSRLIIANSAYLLPFDGLECLRPGISYEEILKILTEEGIADIGLTRPSDWLEEMRERWSAPKIAPKVIKLWDGTHIRLVDRRSEDGDIVSMGLNITETVRYENALEKERDRAQAATRAKSAFLANMSHEIRTPMNGVVGMAELMADTPLDDEQRLYVETICNSGNALLSIINDVLDFSKMDAAKLTLNTEPFDLEMIIHEIITLMQPSVQEKGIGLLVDYDLFLPTLYEGDPLRVRQILTNLVGNAVKFTTEGHVLVRVVGLPVEPGPRQRVHIAVEDTGIGIPTDMQQHIFGEFNQVEDERNRNFEGTGLGLAITRQLVELMGGEIWVDSEEGVGSSFGIHLTFPIAEEAPQTNVPDGLRRAALVMPDGIDRQILQGRLMAMGIEICDTASSVPPDLVFIDTEGSTPPDETAGKLRAEGIQAPLVLLAPVSDETLHHPPAEFEMVLQKPLLRSAFNALLNNMVLPASSSGSQSGPAGDKVRIPAQEAEAEPDNPPPPAMFGSVRQRPAPAPAPEPETVSEAQDGPETEAETTPEPPAIFGSRRRRPPEADAGTPAAPPVASAPSEPVRIPDSSPRPMPEPAPEPAPEPEPAAPEISGLRKMRILAAEDNKTNRLVFSKLVKALDIELTFATNGFEAVEAFQKVRPDLVFMDISMPGMDGKEATRTIRAWEQEQGLAPTRVVALTAHAMTGDGDEILSHGLDAHLTKPLRKPAILAEIEAANPPDAAPALGESVPEKAAG